MVLRLPELFMALADFMRACPGEMSENKLDAALSSIDCQHAEEIQQFRTLMLEYYSDMSWKTHDKRGYIVECVIASLDPEALGLPECPRANKHRHGFFASDSGKLCGDADIDLLLEAGRVVHGVECKANLSNWLTRKGSISREAERKLGHLVCLFRSLPRLGIDFSPWLASFQYRHDRNVRMLKDNGYSCIRLIDGKLISNAIRRAVRPAG